MIYNQRERICQLSGRAAENNRLLHTLPRFDLLCMKNWGTQWTIEITSNE